MNEQRAAYLKEVYVLGRAAYMRKYATPKQPRQPKPRIVRDGSMQGPFVSPIVIKCAWPGWLARAAPNDLFQIAVTAETEQTARAVFAETFASWLQTWAETRPPSQASEP